MLRRLTGIALFALAATASSVTAGAQAVLGGGDDALTVPAGTFRLRAAGLWRLFDEQYDSSGTRAALGAPFTLDTVGVAQIPSLAPLQSALRSLAANNALSVSLGRTAVSASGRSEAATFGAAFGLTSWLQIGVTVPVVRVRSNVFLSANPTGTEGNVGVNPARANSAALASDSAFATQIVAAAQAVAAYCTGAGASTPQCTSGGATLASSAQTFGTGLAQVYDSATFVPTQGGAIQTAIDARAAGIVSQLNAFAAIAGSGVPPVTATGVVAAPLPLATPQMQQLLADSSFGIGVDSLRTIERYHLGDIEVAAKLLLLDSFHGHTPRRLHPHGVNARLALGVAYRFPTGDPQAPDEMLDAPIGTHEAAIGGRGYLDLLFGRHFWTSLVARYDKSRGSDVTLRVPGASDQPFIPFYRTAAVHRVLGTALEVEATPRWEVNDFLSLTAQYLYRHTADDQYTGTPYTVGPDALTGGETITVDPNTLGVGSAQTERRVAWGVSFSNFAAAAHNRHAMPIEVSYLHFQTVAGRNVPQQFSDQIQLRVYARVFGR